MERPNDIINELAARDWRTAGPDPKDCHEIAEYIAHLETLLAAHRRVVEAARSVWYPALPAHLPDDDRLMCGGKELNALLDALAALDKLEEK